MKSEQSIETSLVLGKLGVALIEMDASGLATFLDIFLLIGLIVGCIKILRNIWNIFGICFVHCCRARCQKKDRLYREYGLSPDDQGANQVSSENKPGAKVSWAVITGGSDGIGFGMAKNLAVNSGFNICIIARNAEKMQAKLNEISELCGHKIQTKYIVADFGEMKTIQDYQDTLVGPLQGLDIGVLILNAGWAQMGPFEMITQDEVEKHMTLNILSVIYPAKVLTSQLLERFEKTGKKSAMIITSSGLGLFPCAGCIAYSCGKAFDDFLARGLHVEFKGKVDVISYNAGMVNTPLIRDEDVKKQAGSQMIIPDEAAACCFRDVGYKSNTKGAFKHSIADICDQPYDLISNVFFKMSAKQYIKEKGGMAA